MTRLKLNMIYKIRDSKLWFKLLFWELTLNLFINHLKMSANNYTLE